MAATAEPSYHTQRFARGRRTALRVGVPVGVALLLLVCYWLTLAPTISERDSGELAAAVHVMGVPHPTGYPLYLIVGKLFDLLPLGEPARRIAFFSAASAAAAGGLIAWVVVALTGSAAAGVVGGLAVGLNRSLWSQANQVEVYAFHAFLVSLLLAMFVRWLQLPSRPHLSQLAFVSGLALTHHRTSLFFIMPLLGWAIIGTRPTSARLLFARTALWGFAPLLLYLWLPFRSAQHPPLNWGNTAGSLANFVNHISGRLYAHYAFAVTPSDAVLAGGRWLGALPRQFLPLGLGLALVGAVWMIRLRRDRALGVSLVIAFVVVIVWAAFYWVQDQEVFFMPATIVLALWCGAGVGYLVRGIGALRLGPRVTGVLAVCAAALAVAVPANMAARNWKRCDRSRSYEVREYAELIMAGVPSNAVLLLASDEPWASAVYYWYALRRGAAPTVLAELNTLRPWCEPLLEPRIRRAAADARSLAPNDPTPVLLRLTRRFLEPARALCVNWPPEEEVVPTGYVMARDYTLTRLVRPPVIGEARDAPGGRPLLELPRAVGRAYHGPPASARDGARALQLLGVSTPAQVRRGRPFPVVACVRWTGVGPLGDLCLVFARSEVAEKVRRSRAKTMLARREGVRKAPLLFGLKLPASRPGHHYEQRFYALLGRELAPGRYRVFVELINGTKRTPLTPAGDVYLR